jgi:hypothetical protein
MGELAAADAYQDGVTLPDSAIRGLELTDEMSPALRQCVHEFGFPIVDAFLTLGVTQPRHIRHLVTACWLGARSPLDRPRRSGGPRSGLLDQLDWLLIQSGSAVSAETLLRLIKQSGFVILPLDPTNIMVDASIEATAEMGLVSKREKHRGRLAAALRAGAVRMWPHLFAEPRR